MFVSRIARLLKTVDPAVPARLFLLSASVVAAVACGKPATMEDCEQIVARMTELELKANNITDPVLIEKQIAHTQKSFRERALEQCVGRQISSQAIQCVASATTPDQILVECLD